MTVQFECRTNMAMSQSVAFDRARNIDDHMGSMARSREKAVGGVTSGLIAEGQEVAWRAVHFGIPLRMTNRISSMTAPTRFVDEQVRGPFRSFEHEHEFRAESDGTTTMIDRVSFAAPFGVLGLLAEKLVLARYMRRLIEQRNEFLARS